MIYAWIESKDLLSIELASSQDKTNTFAFSNASFIAYKTME
jgi:hypothetical protein